MSTTDTIRKDLAKHFGAAVNQDDLMEKCVSICTELGLTGEDLYYKWEAFSYSARTQNSMISFLTAEGAESLAQKLRQEHAMASLKTPAKSTQTSSRARGLPPSALRGLTSSTSKLASSPFPTPKNAAVLKQPAESPGSTVVHHKPEAQFTPPYNSTDYDYRYMYEKLSERSEVMDDLIDEFSEIIKSHYGIEEFHDPSRVSEEGVMVVTRICSDFDLEAGTKLTENSILLESSRNLGHGSRVPLAFSPECSIRNEAGVQFDGSGRPGMGFFPGQLVLLKGRNGDGLRFVASEVWPLPRLRAPSHIYSAKGAAKRTEIMVAAGPYTFDKDLEFTPFSRLLSEVQRRQPTALILMGPFIDCNNELIKTANITESPIDTFQKCISAPLAALLGNVPGLSVVLVPSIRDVIHDHCVTPQKPLAHERLGLSKYIHLVPNPSIFTINDIAIGVGTADTLMHINGQQFLKRFHLSSEPPLPSTSGYLSAVQSSDPMSLLARHILEQRSFYPVNPGPREQSSTVNLDVTHSHLLRIGVTRPDSAAKQEEGTIKREEHDLTLDESWDGSAPHILILPSRLKQFHRIVDHTMVVNPSFATRGQDVNSYARMSVPPASSVGPATPLNDASVDPAPSLASKMSVDLVKMDF
ncbi:DNA polymerase alpha/epsilon subunit B-domain-containing protein [Cantharellus anzutake]|uniref:DNA polymerase alpha/epsilon subunit B-domain-containing protein n=1 Tax=Cantharellus anzutake TaxID=1750568 RepID=UPI001908082C|nr:DNA polymerase alpha/epsilon subunit B-domain-containing protein [Cantharellus anzutake]KAF8333523.1 DNA polymerase alpha/epsilon subunit B-domain-containing protein [Cantharellus anzutake]